MYVTCRLLTIGLQLSLLEQQSSKRPEIVCHSLAGRDMSPQFLEFVSDQSQSINLAGRSLFNRNIIVHILNCFINCTFK